MSGQRAQIVRHTCFVVSEGYVVTTIVILKYNYELYSFIESAFQCVDCKLG